MKRLLKTSLPIMTLLLLTILILGEGTGEGKEKKSFLSAFKRQDKVSVKQAAIAKKTTTSFEGKGDLSLEDDKLLEKSFEDEKQSKGVTRLMMMAFHDRGDKFQELLEEAKRLGKSISDLRDNEGGTLLHWAIMGNCESCISSLLKSLPTVDLKNNRGETPLVFAVGAGDSNIAKILLEKGADPNVKFNEAGYTLLMDSSFEGLSDVAEMLINKKADLNAQDKEGMSALHYAAREGHVETIKLLIEKGANKSLQDSRGKKPADYALENHDSDVTRLFL